MKEEFLKQQELILLKNEEMIIINGGGKVWRKLGEICRGVVDFFNDLAEASSETYHMGMM